MGRDSCESGFVLSVATPTKPTLIVQKNLVKYLALNTEILSSTSHVQENLVKHLGLNRFGHWWPVRDLNPHARRRRILSPLGLPIPPTGQHGWGLHRQVMACLVRLTARPSFAPIPMRVAAGLSRLPANSDPGDSVEGEEIR